MTYFQNTHRLGFKLTFADWLFSLIEELYEIDVLFQEKTDQ
jgi:hypothetical protein